jgi:beta-glucanase (GH16 family)
VCTLDDEFSGTTLNSADWTPFTSVAGGFRGGAECYTPKNVSVSNGTLNLPTTRAAAPFNCAGKVASYYSGMVVSKQKFTQAYGRFEMRAKIPMSKGLHAAFWLLPESSYNAKGQLDYGEIDVMESGGAYKDIASPHLHYVLTPGDVQSGNYCVVPNMATQFHNYTLVWTPTTMTFSYDGHTCWQTTWQTAYPYQPLGAHAPAPFDQPFYLILNMGTDTAQTIAANAVSSATNLSQPMQVDYVRVWK